MIDIYGRSTFGGELTMALADLDEEFRVPVRETVEASVDLIRIAAQQTLRAALVEASDADRHVADVIDVLTDLFILRGPPLHVRSDNGPEFVAKAVRQWIEAVGAKTAYIELGSPWDRP